jgi:hypothetical protein
MKDRARIKAAARRKALREQYVKKYGRPKLNFGAMLSPGLVFNPIASAPLINADLGGYSDEPGTHLPNPTRRAAKVRRLFGS